MDVMQAVVGDQQWSLVRYDSGYWVELHEPNKFTRWGPIDSCEQAMQVSGFPKPKTEVEELWEWAKATSDALVTALSRTNDVHVYDVCCSRFSKLRKLEAKWKK